MPSSTLTIKYSLPFVQAEIVCRGTVLKLEWVLVDTGSESSMFEADLLRPLGMIPGEDELLQVVYGVGGVESVYAGQLETISIGALRVGPVDIDVGRTGHGFGIDAILGMDFLDRTGAIVDLPARLLRFTNA